jgi:uncharacterized protein (DUF2336 family)
MSAPQTVQDLTTLAQSRSREDRERLMLGIVALCDQADPSVRTAQVQALLDSIFLNLITSAEHDIRRLLAEKLALADWPPAALVRTLARDEIEIARPIIATSPVLSDTDLVRLLVEATVEHQIEVARRPCVGPAVVETILSQAEPAVLTALAGNDTANISPEAMTQLVEASRQIAGMRSPLVRHPRLTTEMAQRLYIWVGESLRSAIVTRYRVDADALDKAIAEAVNEAQVGVGLDAAIGPAPVDTEQRRMEARLIGKLHEAGQLRPSYLLRALREHKLSLFEAALAALGGYTPHAVHLAVNAERPEMLAMACAGVGVDRGAFATILALVRELNRGRPGGDNLPARETFDRFGGDQSAQAALAFQQAAAV